MRTAARIIVVIGVAISVCWGCAGSRKELSQIPPTILTVTPGDSHINRVALVLTHTPDTAIGRQFGGFYVKALEDGLREEGRRLRLATAQDSEKPAFFEKLNRQGVDRPDTFDLAAEARISGYSGWAEARIESIRTVEMKTGIVWFRKTRHFIFFDLTLTIYDAFTGAKLFNEVNESSVQISPEDYEAIQNGQWAGLKSFEEIIADLASDLSEKAVEVLDDQPWRASVLKVEGDRIFLAAGSLVGLSVGDRLAILEGQRTIHGQNGEKFIVPGYQVGEIEIIHVAEQMSEGQERGKEGGKGIQAGDVAVAIK